MYLGLIKYRNYCMIRLENGCRNSYRREVKIVRKLFKFPVQNSDFVKSMWTGKHNKCVEVARKPEGVAVRDSKDTKGPVLYFTNDEWDAFLRGAKGGEFDLG